MPSYELSNLLMDKPETFTDVTAPQWLKFGGYKGSTMDNRWFWDKHIKPLDVGESVETDFSTITRVS